MLVNGSLYVKYLSYFFEKKADIGQVGSTKRRIFQILIFLVYFKVNVLVKAA